MAKVAFGTTFLGDGLVWLGSEYTRLARAERTVLWSSGADVPEESPNFVWRIRAVVSARRADCVALATALENLALSLGGACDDLKVYEDDGTTLLRTYPSCRFDGMERSAPPAGSRRNFERRVTFLFTTSSDPE